MSITARLGKVRIESAEAGLERAIAWSKQAVNSDMARGSYSSTKARAAQMLSGAEELIRNLKKLIGDDTDDVSGSSGDPNNHSDIEEIIARTSAATVKALIDYGVIASPDSYLRDRASDRQVMVTRSATKEVNTEKQEVCQCGVTQDVQITRNDGVDDTQTTEQSVQQPSSKSKDWGSINKIYGRTILNTERYSSDKPIIKACLEFIPRWYNVIKESFHKDKGKRVRLGANKFGESIVKLVAKISYHVKHDSILEFEDVFDDWERKVRYNDFTYGLPAGIGAVDDTGVLVDVVKHPEDSAWDAASDAMDWLLMHPLNGVKRTDKNNSDAFISRSMVDSLLGI